MLKSVSAIMVFVIVFPMVGAKRFSKVETLHLAPDEERAVASSLVEKEDFSKKQEEMLGMGVEAAALAKDQHSSTVNQSWGEKWQLWDRIDDIHHVMFSVWKLEPNEKKLEIFDRKRKPWMSIIKEYRELSMNLHLKAGNYMIVPSCKKAKETGKFYLNIYFSEGEEYEDREEFKYFKATYINSYENENPKYLKGFIIAEEDEEDGGNEYKLRRFVRLISYINFFFKIILVLVFWKDSLDFRNIIRKNNKSSPDDELEDILAQYDQQV